MSGRGSARRAARLRRAAALCSILAAPAVAQTASPPPPPPNDPTELDPSAPLAPLPDLEVGWPDLNRPDEPPGAQGPTAEPGSQPDAGDRHYSVVIEGLREIGGAEGLLEAFRRQSALESDRKSPANAAQITRRSRAD